MNWQLILTLLLSAGTLGFIGTMVKLFVIDKKKNDTDIKQQQIEIQKDQVELTGAEMTQIATSAKVVKDLLVDLQSSNDLARTAKNENVKLVKDNDRLTTEVHAKTEVIAYQKDERKDWMEMLKTTIDANSKREKDFEKLTRDVQELKTKENQCQENVTNLEGRLNLCIGIMKKNNLELPEGFIWTNSSTNIVYPQTQK